MQKEITGLAPSSMKVKIVRLASSRSPDFADIFNQGCTSRAQVLCLDRRIYLGLSVDLPANVDQQAGVRR